MPVNTHTHCEFSDDSDYPIEQVIVDAIDRQLDTLYLSDHVDYGVKVDLDEGKPIPYVQGYAMTSVDDPRCFEAIEALRKNYRERIFIGADLEFGVQKHTMDRYRTLTRSYPLDYILLSIHEIDDQEFWTGEYQAEKSQDEIEQGCCQTMLDVITQYKDCDVLAHPDLICRCDPYAGIPLKS